MGQTDDGRAAATREQLVSEAFVALADVATIGILQERAIRRGEVLNEQLQAALDGRVVIEQATGVIAHHTGQGMEVAFEMVRRFARDRSVRLDDIARQVVEGELDADTLRGSASPVRRRGRTDRRHT